ncbi:hypothetical protein [Streptomyces sp. NBC_01361]|uniref:hypothetical protein n=1 Tax=Streptomyces sp. NBC_01361 TaxID=2903838 RepID=UPI002E36FCD6|nr:hypothetical protein [Streptomyces sp. NBC_01361]
MPSPAAVHRPLPTAFPEPASDETALEHPLSRLALTLLALAPQPPASLLRARHHAGSPA